MGWARAVVALARSYSGCTSMYALATRAAHCWQGGSMTSKTRLRAPAFILAMAPVVLWGRESTDRERREAEGLFPESAASSAVARRAEPRRPPGFSVDVLLVPDAAADRVMAFHPTTG